MEFQENTTPEPSLSESVPHDPPIETERKPLKPGKWYGIIALLCGLVPLLVVFYFTLLEVFGVNFYQSPLNEINHVIGATWIPCLIVALIFGIMGRKTQGRRYANIGIVLILLCVAFMLFLLGFAFYWHVILGHPT